MERRLIWRPGHLGSLPALGRESQGNALILLGLGVKTDLPELS